MIRLHHIPHSRSFRILWLLAEMGLECELVEYAITDGSLRQPEFLAISPAGRIPALEIDGITLFESGAIIEYLCETRPEHGFGRAIGDVERPKWLEWLHFAETQAMLVADLNLQHLFLRDPKMRSLTILKIDTARLTATLKAMEIRLQGQDWLLASGFSAVDTMMGFNLLAAGHFVRLDRFPALQAYMARFQARSAFQQAMKLNGEAAFYSRDFYELPDE